MLIGIDPILNADILDALRAIGHGDEIVIADGSFPAQTVAKRLIRTDASDLQHVLKAVLSVMPVDKDEPDLVLGMEVIGEPDKISPAHTRSRRNWMVCRTENFRSSASNVLPSTIAPRKRSL